MKKKIAFISVCFLLFLTSCTHTSSNMKINIDIDDKPSLIIYTPLSSDIYKPIIKEFQERNNIPVKVYEESEETILYRLRNNSANYNCDIIFGLTYDSIIQNKKFLESYSAFCSIPFVIIYNNNLVTYHETVHSFSNLVEPYWKGQIGFVDPELSMIYKNVLQFMANGSNDPEQYRQLFLDNINGNYAISINAINTAVVNGDYSIGITSEQSAKSLSENNVHIKYVYPSEGKCIITIGTGIVNNSKNKYLADEFTSFIDSNDVKQFIIHFLNINPSDSSERR